MPRTVRALISESVPLVEKRRLKDGGKVLSISRRRWRLQRNQMCYKHVYYVINETCYMTGFDPSAALYNSTCALPVHRKIKLYEESSFKTKVEFKAEIICSNIWNTLTLHIVRLCPFNGFAFILVSMTGSFIEVTNQ